MPTVLVVDDEPIMLKLCANVLKSRGYRVLEAGAPQDALRVLERGENADLALLDIIMPGMNGIQLANRIRQTNPQIKVVLMTGYGPREIAQVTGGENPYRIIWKPFKAESLLQMIENV